MQLRYGTNPHQSAVVLSDPVPFQVLSGDASYINVLDALNAWALVRELREVTGLAAAASFKHVSPAGAALSGPLDAVMKNTWALHGPVDEVTSAYVRARDADPKSSFGDFVAVSEPVTLELARFLKTVVSDGIIAPGFEPGALAELATKKRGTFLVLEMQKMFEPAEVEERTVFGVRLQQDRDVLPIDPDAWSYVTSDGLSRAETLNAILGMVTLRHTQSNSVLMVKDRMCLGIGAGQQSRIDCTRVAGTKAAIWWLRRHLRLAQPSTDSHDKSLLASTLQEAEDALAPRWLGDGRATLRPQDVAAWVSTLSGVTAASDGYLPFADNIEEMARYGVTTVVEPGGSMRSPEVLNACHQHGIQLVQTGHRLFHH